MVIEEKPKKDYSKTRVELIVGLAVLVLVLMLCCVPLSGWLKTDTKDSSSKRIATSVAATVAALPAPTEKPEKPKTGKEALTDTKAPGIYLVGVDIAPGVWRSQGSSDECYWEITTKTGTIIENHSGMAGGTMYIPKKAFQVLLDSECGNWEFLEP